MGSSKKSIAEPESRMKRVAAALPLLLGLVLYLCSGTVTVKGLALVQGSLLT